MIGLTPDECRVLGVLVEKELTTPDQYPLSLNALVNGCNQKNNRDPVVSFDNDRAYDAAESLRQKGLVMRVDQGGSRVHKYRHQATEKLQINRYELVILAELLLRGPQTVGELRGRASRMHHLETIEVVTTMLQQLIGRPEPMVRQLPPAPGSRAERFMQLLCPDAHPIDAPPAALATMPSNQSMTDRIALLESRVVLLRDALRKIAASLGEPDPTADWDDSTSSETTEKP
jgi:hypothetical protein